MSEKFEDVKEYISSKVTYGIDGERLDEIESFHESTKFYPANRLNKSIKIGNYMTYPYYVHETSNNYKPYPLSRKIDLPEMKLSNLSIPFDDLIQNRYSCRNYEFKKMGLQTLSDLLGSSAGVVKSFTPEQFPEVTIRTRRYPSAGGLYPIEIYPVLLGVEGIEPCVTHYDPINHKLDIISDSVDREQLVNALADFDSDGKTYVDKLSLVLILSSSFQRVVVKYEERGYRFALLEGGIVGHNISLCASALGWQNFTWGSYYEGMLDEILGLDGVSESTINCLFIGNSAPASPKG